jgi:hypothetical protein
MELVTHNERTAVPSLLQFHRLQRILQDELNRGYVNIWNIS